MHPSSHMQILFDKLSNINKELKFFRISVKEYTRGSVVTEAIFFLTYIEDVESSQRLSYSFPIFKRTDSGILNYYSSDEEFFNRLSPILDELSLRTPLVHALMEELLNHSIEFTITKKLALKFEMDGFLPYLSNEKKSLEDVREDYDLEGTIIFVKLHPYSEGKVKYRFNLLKPKMNLSNRYDSFDETMKIVKDLRNHLNSLLVSYLEYVVKRAILDLSFIKKCTLSEEYLARLSTPRIEKQRIYGYLYEDASICLGIYPSGNLPKEDNLKEVLISNEDLAKIRDKESFEEVPVSIQIFDSSTQQFSAPVQQKGWSTDSFLGYLKYFHPF